MPSDRKRDIFSRARVPKNERQKIDVEPRKSGKAATVKRKRSNASSPRDSPRRNNKPYPAKAFVPPADGAPRERSERPAFSRDKPRFSRDDKPRFERKPFDRDAPRERAPRSDRPAFSREKPAFNRDEKPRFERKPFDRDAPRDGPKRTFSRSSDKPRFSRDDKPRFERKSFSRDGPRSDAPPRRFVRKPAVTAEPTPQFHEQEKFSIKDARSIASGKKHRPAKMRKTTPHQPKAPGSKHRVQKLIAASGLASRREAEEWIAQGRVTVNGAPIKLGDSAFETDTIAVNGAPIEFPKKVYLLLHKPKGFVTTRKDIYGNKTVMDLVPSDERIYPIGRLDKDTTGLLLFTNDGEFANRLMHPSYEVQKTYIATLNRPFDHADKAKFAKGIRLKEGLVQASVNVLSPRRVEVTLHQGFNHVVKRIFKELDYWVEELERTKVGIITLNIPERAFRPLTDAEIKSFWK